MERLTFDKCSEQKFDAFIRKIENNKKFIFKAHNPAAASVLQDRFTYTLNNQRISIVYETKAQTLIITAPSDIINEVICNFGDAPNKDAGLLQNLSNDNYHVNMINNDHKPNKDGKVDKSKLGQDKDGKVDKPRLGQDKDGKVDKPRLGQDKDGKVDKPKLGQDKDGKVDKSKLGQDKDGKVDKPKLGQDKDGKVDKSKLGQDKDGKVDKPRLGQDKDGKVDKPRLGQDKDSKVDKPRLGQDKDGKVDKPRLGQDKDGKVDKPRLGQDKDGKVDKPRLGQDKDGKIKRSVSNNKFKNHDERKAMNGTSLDNKESEKVDDYAKKSKTKEHIVNGNITNRRKTKGKADVVRKEPHFEIKNITFEKLKELLKKVRINKSMRYKTISEEDSKIFAVTMQDEKAKIRYINGTLELFGQEGKLLNELQLMISQVSDYKTAIKTHIKLVREDKRAGDVEKELKKKLPSAFEFLSEQSKIDLAIAIIDINNTAVVLSDYSTLLIPCFRGLERLIFDLQHAQGIVVKMIGQAYEKEDGSYVLKSGYRRRIPSVIYAEVMASLYTEYFKQRNFYAHSDGGYDNISRIITDKQQVQNIFNHILEVINYNGKKLKEIGFTI